MLSAQATPQQCATPQRIRYIAYGNTLLPCYTPTHTLQYLPNKCPISILTAYKRYILRTQTVCKRHTKAYWQVIASVGGGGGLRSLRLAHSIAYSPTVRLTEQAIVLCTNFCSKHIFHGRVISHHETTNTLEYKLYMSVPCPTAYTTRPHPICPHCLSLYVCMPFVCLLYTVYIPFIYRLYTAPNFSSCCYSIRLLTQQAICYSLMLPYAICYIA